VKYEGFDLSRRVQRETTSKHEGHKEIRRKRTRGKNQPGISAGLYSVIAPLRSEFVILVAGLLSAGTSLSLLFDIYIRYAVLSLLWQYKA